MLFQNASPCTFSGRRHFLAKPDSENAFSRSDRRGDQFVDWSPQVQKNPWKYSEPVGIACPSSLSSSADSLANLDSSTEMLLATPTASKCQQGDVDVDVDVNVDIDAADVQCPETKCMGQFTLHRPRLSFN